MMMKEEEEKALRQQEQQQKVISNKFCAKLKGWLFIAFIIAFAVLSGTVLRDPLADSSDWVRSQGIKGYFVVGGASWLFLMIGGSANFIDLGCGFIYGPKIGKLSSLATGGDRALTTDPSASNLCLSHAPPK